MSSVVVLLVAIPLCLGIALASKAPLFSGIIAGIVGGIVVGILSGSNLSVSGPAAGLTTIVAAGILKLQSFEIFLLAVVLAGVFQVIFGVLKLGKIGDYIPNSVIKGMLGAIGLILILKQLPHFLGSDMDYEGDENFQQPDHENTFTELWRAIESTSYPILIIGMVSLLILIVWGTRFFKKNKVLSMIPAPLIVVVVGIVFQQLYAGSSWMILPEHLVNLPVAGAPSEFFTFFSFPAFSAIGNFGFAEYQTLFITAATLAIVASLETLLGLEAVDKLDSQKRISPPNRELVAQGAGNIVSGLIGGLPLTSVIVRSSANVTAGARTKLSAILHGVLMLICVISIPGLLNLIPKASLAAILIFTGYKLVSVTILKSYFKKGWDQFMPFIITLVAIVLSDLLIGVAIGVCVGVFYTLRTNFNKSILLVNDGDNYLLKLRRDVSFFDKALLKEKLSLIPANSYLLIDTLRADFVDKDIVEEMNSFIQGAPDRNIRVEIKNEDKIGYKAIFTTPIQPQ